MSGIRVNEWLHNSGTGGIWQTSAGNVGIASSVPTTKLEVTGDAKISGVTTATAFVPSQGQLSNRNLIINGAFQIAQRATTSTSGDYCAVDRFGISNNGLDEATTNSQHTLTSSDTGPWAEGFRKSFHVQNGNQTSGAGVDDRVAIYYKPEAQDIANSGWDYTNSSSYITLSFWVKSSVAQNFYGRFTTEDGTQYSYPFETGSLTANTWKKVIKVIPGNSNLAFDDNNGIGATLEWDAFRGTNKTGSITLETWAAFVSAVRIPDMASTWYTTNDAIFEITGVQLEVGQAATPFEHRSHSDELARCQRYFFNIKGDQYDAAGILGYALDSEEIRVKVEFPVPMRQMPTYTGNAKDCKFKANNTSSNMHWSNLSILNSQTTPNPKSTMMKFDKGSSLSVTAGECGDMEFHEDGGELQFSAEF